MVGTLSGGLLGFATSLIMDVVRAKRERVHRLDQARREAYAQYLVTLTETDGALQVLALNETTPVDRSTAVSTFRSKSLLASLYQVVLVAPPPIAEAADDTYRKLRAIREAISTESLAVSTPGSEMRGSDNWEAVHGSYDKAIAALRAAMQADVQNA